MYEKILFRVVSILVLFKAKTAECNVCSAYKIFLCIVLMSGFLYYFKKKFQNAYYCCNCHDIIYFVYHKWFTSTNLFYW